jgi:hypothetical protein
MPLDDDYDRFVSVGGLGGSGTRVVAQILQKMGFYIGPVLNGALDNILFTLLFKRQDWITCFPDAAEIDRIAEIFEIAMRDGVQSAFTALAPGEAEQMFEMAQGHGVKRPFFDAILASPPPDHQVYSGLAWKEPNTHVFLPHLLRQFPRMKYIHVMRNGLDMALSRNRQQLKNWGGQYGIGPDMNSAPPNVQLKFWLAANHRIIEFGKAMPRGQFYLLNYDDLCQDFSTEIKPIEAFLERDLTDADKAFLDSHIGSGSAGRFRKAPADTFSAQERDAVRQLGFAVT